MSRTFFQSHRSPNEFEFTSPGTYTFEYSDDTRKEIRVTDQSSEFLVEGPWEIYFPEENHGAGKVMWNKLISWTSAEDNRIQFFSGIAEYSNKFILEKEVLNSKGRIYLEMEDIKEVATVFVNEQKVGVCWVKPFVLDIFLKCRFIS